MKITLDIHNTENIKNLTDYEIKSMERIVLALVTSGGLTGVKGGQTIIHFDPTGKFVGVQLSYWPFKLRENERT